MNLSFTLTSECGTSMVTHFKNMRNMYQKWLRITKQACNWRKMTWHAWKLLNLPASHQYFSPVSMLTCAQRGLLFLLGVTFTTSLTINLNSPQICFVTLACLKVLRGWTRSLQALAFACCFWHWMSGFCRHSRINEKNFTEGMLSFTQRTNFWLKKVSNLQLNSIQLSASGEYFPLNIPPVPPSETVPSYLHPPSKTDPNPGCLWKERKSVLCMCSFANIYTLTCSFIVLMWRKPGLLCQRSLGQSCCADVFEARWWK